MVFEWTGVISETDGKLAECEHLMNSKMVPDS